MDAPDRAPLRPAPLCGAPEALDCGKDARLDQPKPETCSRLRAACPQSGGLRAACHDPPHAQASRSKPLITSPNFSDGLLVIKTKAELVELLFQELDESEPRQEVDPSFLLRVGGICHGLIYGGWDGVPPYLEDTFSIHFEDEHPTTCGVRLLPSLGRLPPPTASTRCKSGRWIG